LKPIASTHNRHFVHRLSRQTRHHRPKTNPV
jgi:hypothetical protein